MRHRHAPSLLFASLLPWGVHAADVTASEVGTTNVTVSTTARIDTTANANTTPDVQQTACTPLTPYAGQPLEGFEPANPLPADGSVKVGAIRIVHLPVFDLTDPEQNWWPYRLANDIRDYFGLNTREWVTANDLLFKSGDQVAVRTLAESERLLRQHRYVYDARVLPARRCGDAVDIDVVTRDVWTLSPRLDLSRSGGSSNLGVGLSDSNFLGTGKRVSGGYRKTVDSSGVDISFFDPNVVGTHDTFGVAVAKTKDGYFRRVEIERPFFSFDSQFSWGASVVRGKSSDKLYFRGDDFARFRHVSEAETVFAGWSPGLIDGKQFRVRVGMTRTDDHFEIDPGRTPPPKLAADRALTYPFVGIESVEEDFHITKNLNRLQLREDLYLGQSYSLQLGYSAQGNDRYVLSANYADGFRFGADGRTADGRTLVLYDLAVQGNWRRDIHKPENLEVDAHIRIRDQQSRHFAAYASLGATWTDHLTFDKQLLLGGDSGLRGYPLRYQVGDRRFLISLEERYFSDLYVMKLLRVGGAVFVDVGRSWFPSNPNSKEFGVLGDVGIGLRLESTRTPSGNLIHIDLAVPLVDGQRVKGLQLLLSVQQSL